MKTNWHITIRNRALQSGIKFDSWRVSDWHIITAYDPSNGRFGLSFCHDNKETFDRKFGQALAFNRLLAGRKYTGLTTDANWCNTAYLVGYAVHVNGDILPSNLERKLQQILV